jgi:hypothetical protein
MTQLFIVPKGKSIAGWAMQGELNISPKWRRQTLPGRWMRPGSFDCKMIEEIQTVSWPISLPRPLKQQAKQIET